MPFELLFMGQTPALMTACCSLELAAQNGFHGFNPYLKQNQRLVKTCACGLVSSAAAFGTWWRQLIVSKEYSISLLYFYSSSASTKATLAWSWWRALLLSPGPLNTHASKYFRIHVLEPPGCPAADMGFVSISTFDSSLVKP